MAEELYLKGDSNTDGSLRWVDTGAELAAQKRVNGLWVPYRDTGESVSITDYSPDRTGSLSATTKFLTAINDLKSLGGGKLIVPAGTYTVSSMTVNQDWSNIEIVGEGYPTLTCASGRAIFDYGGTEEYVASGAQLTGIAVEGSRVVTLNSSSDPLKPSAGDMVLIVSCARDNPMSTTYVPYGEWNEVASVSSATVTLRYQLRHTYRPATVTATDYRIIVLTNRPRNFGVRGVNLVHSTNMPYEVHGWNIWLEDCSCEGLALAAFRGRFIRANYRGRIGTTQWYNGSSGRRPYVMAVDTTTTDFDIKFRADVGGFGWTHIHEGVCHGSVECDVNCAESEPDANALTDSGVISLDNMVHDVRVRAAIFNAPHDHFVKIAGTAFTLPGPHNVEVDLLAAGTAYGKVASVTGTSGSNSTTPLFPTILRGRWDGVQTDGTGGAVPFTDAGYYLSERVAAWPIRMGSVGATAPATTGTESGTGLPIINLPNSGSPVVNYQLDLPLSYYTKRAVFIVAELAGLADGDGTAGNAQTRIDLQFGQNTAGNSIASWPTAVSQFPIFWKAGSFCYASAYFLVDNTKPRCGFLLTRLSAAGADVFAQDIYLRRAWMIFTDPWRI